MARDFPDLTGDGQVTRADVLKGRGVFKRGGRVKKYSAGGMSADEEADLQALKTLKQGDYDVGGPKRRFARGKVKRFNVGGNVPGKRSKGSGSMQPMQPASKPYQSPPKPAEQHFRDEIRTPVIPDPVKYPEYIEEVGEERISGPRMRKGGSVSSASKRADGCAVRGKTRGKMV